MWHFKKVTYHKDFPYNWAERHEGWEQGWTSDDEFEEKCLALQQAIEEEEQKKKRTIYEYKCVWLKYM